MHTPTAFVLRCADSPSYFYPGDSPSHHLSHPLTARPRTLSKRVSFFLYSFLYFFIFSLLPLFFFFVLPPSIPLFVSASSPTVCFLASLPPSQRSAFLFCFLFCSAAASLYRARRPLFIFCHTFLTRLYFCNVRHSASRDRPHNQAAKAFEQSRLARLPHDLSDYHGVPYEKFIAAERDNG